METSEAGRQYPGIKRGGFIRPDGTIAPDRAATHGLICGAEV
jgi:hypothetical protein